MSSITCCPCGADALERAADDDEDEEEDDEGDEDDEEEAPALVSRPQARRSASADARLNSTRLEMLTWLRLRQAGKKRPAQATDATPQPAKQAKAAGGGKQPNSQTAQAAAAGTPGSSSAAEQSWAKDILAHLKCVRLRCHLLSVAAGCAVKLPLRRSYPCQCALCLPIIKELVE